MTERYRRRHARSVPTRALRRRGAAAARRAGAVGALHRHAERLARTARGTRLRRGDHDRDARPHRWPRRSGLSALLASSALAFDVVKYLGAAYLIAVGIRRLAGLEREQEPHTRETRDLRPALPPGDRRQHAQPEDGALLPRLPAAVRRLRSAAPRGCRSSRSACSSPRSASSATACGRSWPGRSASGSVTAAASRRCSATSPARSSSASARSPR